MKKLLIIFILFLFPTQIFAVEKIYITRPSTNRAIMRPTHNPYAYRSPYHYKRYNQNNAKKIQRLNKLRNLNRLRNINSWNNNFNNGTLTGYSLPITQNALMQNSTSLFGTKYSSPTYNSLFYDPLGNKSYYKHEKFFNENNELNGDCGVKIIYD